MRTVRRHLALLLTAAALALGGVAIAGCGAGSHLVGGAIAHRILNHFVTSAAGRRRLNKLFCLYHGHRVLVDVRNHHDIIAGLNLIAAVHDCKAGFGHRS
jgi:hypothetical protein